MNTFVVPVGEPIQIKLVIFHGEFYYILVPRLSTVKRGLANHCVCTCARFTMTNNGLPEVSLHKEIVVVKC